jgi:hypothetical protein
LATHRSAPRRPLWASQLAGVLMVFFAMIAALAAAAALSPMLDWHGVLVGLLCLLAPLLLLMQWFRD